MHYGITNLKYPLIQYSLYWETLDNRLVYLSYKRMGTGILKVHEPVEAYSIYK